MSASPRSTGTSAKPRISRRFSCGWRARSRDDDGSRTAPAASAPTRPNEPRIAADADAADERFMRLALALGARLSALPGRTPPSARSWSMSSGTVPVIVGAARPSPAAGRTPSASRSPRPGRRPAAPRSMCRSSPARHLGKTPPCGDAILDAGDRPRRLRHRGSRSPRRTATAMPRLRDAGVEVTVGVSGGRGARGPSRPSSRASSTGGPTVTLKLARTRRRLRGRRARASAC